MERSNGDRIISLWWQISRGKKKGCNRRSWGNREGGRWKSRSVNGGKGTKGWKEDEIQRTRIERNEQMGGRKKERKSWRRGKTRGTRRRRVRAQPAEIRKTTGLFFLHPVWITIISASIVYCGGELFYYRPVGRLRMLSGDPRDCEVEEEKETRTGGGSVGERGGEGVVQTRRNDRAASTVPRFIDLAKENERTVEKRSRRDHHRRGKWKNIGRK